MKKTFVIIVLTLLVGGGGGLFLYLSNPFGILEFRSEPYVIKLQKGGFHPAEITIQKGQEVKFVTTLQRPFWPASDLHPTHSIYPEFDPKEPIAGDKSWSFRFDRVGNWDYHDHLAPYFGGTIRVVEGNKNVERANFCEKEEHSMRCWQEKLFVVLNEKGLDAAYDLLSDLYVKEAGFPLQCHNLAHNIGIEAYKLYLRDRDSVLTPKAVYCANGFYHGFMEALLTATGNLDEAKGFCAYVDEKIGAKAPDAALQCYHGIGHGAIEATVSNRKGEKGEWTFVRPALELCEKVSDTPEQLYRCASGVFNAIANFYITEQYGLSARKDNPLWFCQEQPDRYKDSCYGNMNTTLLWLGGNDFSKAAKYVEAMPDDKYAVSAIRYLAGLSTLYLAKQNPADAIFACRALQERLYSPCIGGFTHGFLEHGTPDREYEDALNFCRTPIMNTMEQEVCLRYALGNLSGWYPREKAVQICQSQEEKLRQYCVRWIPKP